MADIERIRGSGGSGEAIRAIVTAARTGGSVTLSVNDTTNFPNKFIGTWGLLNPTTEMLEPNTIRVFYGQLNGTSIDVLGMAPGYTDDGNDVGQVVLIKPTTAWADEIADAFARAHTTDGSIKTVEGGGVVFSTAATEPAPDPDGRVTVWFEPL